jgi:hypothetical protein
MQAMSHLGLTRDALLGIGGEASVFALGIKRVARIRHRETVRETVARRDQLLENLHQTASAVQFSVVPDVNMAGVKMMGKATIYGCVVPRVWTRVNP